MDSEWSFVGGQDSVPLMYKKYEVLNLPVKRQWETVHIDPQV